MCWCARWRSLFHILSTGSRPLNTERYNDKLCVLVLKNILEYNRNKYKYLKLLVISGSDIKIMDTSSVSEAMVQDVKVENTDDINDGDILIDLSSSEEKEPTEPEPMTDKEAAFYRKSFVSNYSFYPVQNCDCVCV